MGKYVTHSVSGFWNDNGQRFDGMVIAEGVWDGIEDEEDEEIFYYLEGSPILGDHGDFTIVEIDEE